MDHRSHFNNPIFYNDKTLYPSATSSTTENEDSGMSVSLTGPYTLDKIRFLCTYISPFLGAAFASFLGKVSGVGFVILAALSMLCFATFAVLFPYAIYRQFRWWFAVNDNPVEKLIFRSSIIFMIMGLCVLEHAPTFLLACFVFACSLSYKIYKFAKNKFHRLLSQENKNILD